MGRMGRASRLDLSPAYTNRERLSPAVSRDVEKEFRVPTKTGSTGVPNVLVVEDEMVLRMRAIDIVEDAGFTPVEAVNADQAIAILESRSDIDLLFTDIQMPGTMDGLKLAHAVHDRWPAIKIVLVSGQVKPSETETPADSRFFRKPLAVDEMISQLQTMIGAGALKILPNTTTDPGENPEVARSPQESVLVAENDNLRLLL